MSADLREQLQASLGAAYTLERELGGGGMARVFVANEARLGRRVVIKVLDPNIAAAVSAERFEREMRVAARLQDPRIVPVLSAGDANGIPYYTMPFLEGESLRARMSRGRVVVAEGVAILRDIALALEQAHACGVVHRDIKPENVLLAGGVAHGGSTDGVDGRVATAVVTDFGIAKALAVATVGDGQQPAPDTASGQSVAALTLAGLSLGTPAYMAPEQALGAGVDGRADIYAWGVVAYELLIGQHPFAAHTSAQSMVAAHLTEIAPPVVARAPEVPSALADLVDRALAKDPADRPPNATELVRILNDVAVSPTRPAHSRRGSATAWRRWGGAAAVAVAIAAVAGVWWARPRTRITPSDIRSVRSIAVLPFGGAGADSAAAYLGGGMADALATALSKLPELRVVANHSGRAGRTVDARDVGKALNVESVLEASVTRFGDRLRIRAHLVRVADGTILWGETYDRTASNMFELEDEVTGTIARELRGPLTGERGLAGVALLRGTNDLKAYDLYQRGREAWRKRGASLRAAIELFNAALALDPGFARAHAGLAMTWVIMPMFDSSVGADSAFTKAQQSANRALALDSSIADAHLAIAYAHKTKWRWEEAEPHFQTALRLAPEDATVHHWYGVQLYAIGKLTQSIDEFRRARKHGPFETTVALDGAIALYSARRYDEARSEVIRGLALDSTRADLRWFQGVIQLAQGRADSAVSSFETVRRMGRFIFDMRAFLSVAHRSLGRLREADAEYAALRRDYTVGQTGAYDLAVAAAGAGDLATALAAVERMVGGRDLMATEVSLPCDPLFDPLRSNPQFEQMLASAGMRCELPSFRLK